MRYGFDSGLDQHRGSGNDFHLVHTAIRGHRGFENDGSFDMGPLRLRRIFRLLDVKYPGLLDVAADTNRRGWRRKRRRTANGKSEGRDEQSAAGLCAQERRSLQSECGGDGILRPEHDA